MRTGTGLRMSVLVIVSWVLLVSGSALAHSVPLSAHWSVSPAQPETGEPVTITINLADQLGGAAMGYDATVKGTAPDGATLTVPLVEAVAGQYVGSFAPSQPGTWRLTLQVAVLDEIQLGTLPLSVQAHPAQPAQPAQLGPPLTSDQWLTIQYARPRQWLTWGEWGVAAALALGWLLTRRKRERV